MEITTQTARSRIRQLFGQLSRFSLVGFLNTAIDLLAFNLLLWLLPTQDTQLLLLYNLLAQCVAALNSFAINKFWTFGDKNPISRQQVMRFITVVTLCFFCNLPLNWFLTNLFIASSLSSPLWMNVAKISSIAGTAVLSFLIMRAWIFATNKGYLLPGDTLTVTAEDVPTVTASRSLSVVLLVYNEEITIEHTISTIIHTLSAWTNDFEVIVVNDGSEDSTEKIVGQLTRQNSYVRMISHQVKRGYGAALNAGSEVATKELLLFIGADSRFDICNLVDFFPLIEDYDAVLGYSHSRYTSWVGTLNGWTWKQLVRFMFGIKVHDVNCMFKLFRTDFFQTHHLETRGAMANVEMIYRFARAGFTYTEVSVRQLSLPGKKVRNIKITTMFATLRELFFCAGKWYREEQTSSMDLF